MAPESARKERLQKLLAHAGIASRRHAEQLIIEGRVTVNGAVITELGTKADPETDHIKVDGKRVGAPERLVYIAMNKPKDCMSTVIDPEGRPTVMDLLRGVKARVYPVGRLDYSSEGLLLLTNDGELAKRRLQRFKQTRSRPFHPASIDRGCFAGRHLPISFEAPKMV